MTTRQTDDDDFVSQTRIINVQNRRRRPGSTQDSAGQSPALTNPVINKTTRENNDDDEFVSETRVMHVQNRRTRPGSAHRPALNPTVAKKAATPTLNDQSANGGFFKWLKRIFGW